MIISLTKIPTGPEGIPALLAPLHETPAVPQGCLYADPDYRILMVLRYDRPRVLMHSLEHDSELELFYGIANVSGYRGQEPEGPGATTQREFIRWDPVKGESKKDGPRWAIVGMLDLRNPEGTARARGADAIFAMSPPPVEGR